MRLNATSCSANEQKGMFSSVHPGFAMVPFDKLVEAPDQGKILDGLKKVSTPPNAGPKKQNELQFKWINDPSKAQLEYVETIS